LVQRLYDIASLEALINDGYTLLTPNLRLARRIKSEWDERLRAAGATAWTPLSVHPLEHWLLEQWNMAASRDQLPAVTPLGHSQVLELWRQVIDDQARQSGDFHLLRTEAIAEMANQARDLLLRWQVDPHSPHIQQMFQFEHDCGTFLRWLRLFEQRLAKAGLCTPVDCLVQLAQLPHRQPASRVALVEFGHIAPLLQAALTTLSPQWHEVSPERRTARRLVHSFTSKRAELQALATWIGQQHRAAPTTTIGVVLSDMRTDRVTLEYLLRREFDCLGENFTSLPVNFSTGVPLDQTPLVRDALAALATGLEHISVPAVVNLLHSRFLATADTRDSATQRFIRKLYALQRETLAVADVYVLAKTVAGPEPKDFMLARQFASMAAMPALAHAALPSAWLERFNEVLSVWGWPGPQVLDSLEYQQLERWSRSLDEFAGLDVVCQPMGFARALVLLRECCARQVSQPQTADSPIQVLGTLEAAGLAFDHLWVCGMQATNWPSPPRPNPFIPVAIQTQSGMPHANSERELTFSTALMDQYARTCSVIHASYYRQHDGVAELPSALLAQFDMQTLPEPAPLSTEWVTDFDSAVVETVDDQFAPALRAEEAPSVTGGSSLLEHQSQCPFRAFARHRLQLAPLPEFTTVLRAGERGSLLHAALYALWGQLQDSTTLSGLDSASEQRAVTDAIDSALAKVRRKAQPGQGTAYWRLEKQYLTRLLLEWLAVERQRSAFSVVAMEQETVLELARMQLRLKVDRIDELPDGSRVVIDYKSGQSSVQDWLGDRPAKPQLPLYAIAEPSIPAALSYAQVRPFQCQFSGLGKASPAKGISTDLPPVIHAEAAEQDWIALNEHWRHALENLAQEFASGVARVDPHRRSACAYCGLQSLCRIDAAVTSSEGEAA